MLNFPYKTWSLSLCSVKRRDLRQGKRCAARPQQSAGGKDEIWMNRMSSRVTHSCSEAPGGLAGHAGILLAYPQSFNKDANERYSVGHM